MTDDRALNDFLLLCLSSLVFWTQAKQSQVFTHSNAHLRHHRNRQLNNNNNKNEHDSAEKKTTTIVSLCKFQFQIILYSSNALLVA